MEDKNTVTYFLFNDRKGTSRCSFILICSLTFFELYSCFTYILPLLYPNTALFYFICSLFPFYFTLILQQFLPLLVSISNFFNLHSRPLSFSNHLHFQPTFPLLFLNKKSFSTPPQSLCTKGMATLSCNNNDIAPQKQCNYQ